jgi:hypothetical protein
MPTTVNEQVTDSVTATNMKTVGESAAFNAGLSMGNSVLNQQLMQTNAIANQQVGQNDTLAHQRRMNILAEISLANTVKGVGEDINEKTPTNAVSDVKTLEASLAPKLADLGSAIASIQQLMKGAQTTLPETGLTIPATITK